MPKGVYPHKKNRVFSAEHRAKLSKARIGYKLSAETKQKLRELNSGSKCPNWKGGIYAFDIRVYKRVKAQERRAKLRQATGYFTIEEWETLKKRYGYTCPSCKRKEPQISLTIDHIVPISKGGTNFIDNIQPLCLSCNSSKSVKVIYFEPITN